MLTSLRDRMTGFLSIMHDEHVAAAVGYPIGVFDRSRVIQHYEVIRQARDDSHRSIVAMESSLESFMNEKERNLEVSMTSPSLNNALF